MFFSSAALRWDHPPTARPVFDDTKEAMKHILADTGSFASNSWTWGLNVAPYDFQLFWFRNTISARAGLVTADLHLVTGHMLNQFGLQHLPVDFKVPPLRTRPRPVEA